MRVLHFLKKPLLYSLVLLALLGSLSLFPKPKISASENHNAGEFVSDQVIIKYKSDANENDKDSVLKEHQAKIKATGYQNKNEVLLEVPSGKVLDIVEKLKNNPKIEVVEPNYIAHERFLPNDPYFLLESPNKQWGIKHIRTPQAWDITQGSEDVKIAILDSGIKEDHPDLQGKVVDRVSFAFCDSSTDDWGGESGLGHGTMVAGIAAASTNNGEGIAGMGYNTKLLNVKISGNGCLANFWTIKEGIWWARNNGANVINMSVGGIIADPLVADAINQAWNANIVLVGAVANSETSLSINDHPAAYEQVIAVTGTDYQDRKVVPAAYGDWVDVAAPGDDMYAPCIYPGLLYCTSTGTSFATPMVSGLAALLFAQHPDWTNQQVRDQIQNTADKIPGTENAPGTTTVLWKHGRINACRAVGRTDCQTLNSGLVAYWKMNEITANTCVGGVNDSCDSSGNNFNGAWNGNATSATGKFGRGVGLDGVNDYLTVGNSASLQLTTFTIAFWVKVDTLISQWNNIINKEANSSTNRNYVIYIHNPSGHVVGSTSFSGLQRDISSNTPINDNAWHHVVYQVGNGKHQIFVDGQLKNSINTTGTPNTPPNGIRMGTDQLGNSDFDGTLDEFRIYNRMLTDYEVSQLYNLNP